MATRPIYLNRNKYIDEVYISRGKMHWTHVQIFENKLLITNYHVNNFSQRINILKNSFLIIMIAFYFLTMVFIWLRLIVSTRTKENTFFYMNHVYFI